MLYIYMHFYVNNPLLLQSPGRDDFYVKFTNILATVLSYFDLFITTYNSIRPFFYRENCPIVLLLNVHTLYVRKHRESFLNSSYCRFRVVKVSRRLNWHFP